LQLLYDLGAETDTLEVIQALLLLVQGLSRGDGLKDRWHWLGIAISLAYTIGLHRIQPDQYCGSREIRMKTRTWWCCVSLDRHIALTEQRPTRIRLEESSTSPLSIDHFDFDSALEGSRRRLAFDNMNGFLQRIDMTLQMNGSCVKSLADSRIAASHGGRKWPSIPNVRKSVIAADFEARVFGHLIEAGYLSSNV
jgi:Fungal specific transcription factor domain